MEAEDDSGRKFIAEPNTLSPGGVIPSDAAPPVGTGGLSGYGGGGGTTERMLAARAVAGVLGVLAFGSGASGAGVANERSLAPPPGVDLTGALVRATKHGELVVTVPWVVSFLRFLPWDAEAATARVYLEPLAALRRMLRSPALAPDAKAGGVDGGGGFFSTPQMALRATLAGGLGAETPTTPAACVAYARDLAAAAGNKSAPPPPPPCASLPSLPATEWMLGLDVGTRTGTREDEDPLRDWGAAVAATTRTRGVGSKSASIRDDSGVCVSLPRDPAGPEPRGTGQAVRGERVPRAGRGDRGAHPVGRDETRRAQSREGGDGDERGCKDGFFGYPDSPVAGAQRAVYTRERRERRRGWRWIRWWWRSGVGVRGGSPAPRHRRPHRRGRLIHSGRKSRRRRRSHSGEAPSRPVPTHPGRPKPRRPDPDERVS